MQRIQGLAASVVGAVNTTRKYLNGRRAFGPTTGHEANCPGLHIASSFSCTLRFVQLLPSIEPYNKHVFVSLLGSSELISFTSWASFWMHKIVFVPGNTSAWWKPGNRPASACNSCTSTVGKRADYIFRWKFTSVWESTSCVCGLLWTYLMTVAEVDHPPCGVSPVFHSWARKGCSLQWVKIILT